MGIISRQGLEGQLRSMQQQYEFHAQAANRARTVADFLQHVLAKDEEEKREEEEQRVLQESMVSRDTTFDGELTDGGC